MKPSVLNSHIRKTNKLVPMWTSVCMCVCVCVSEREREMHIYIHTYSESHSLSGGQESRAEREVASLPFWPSFCFHHSFPPQGQRSCHPLCWELSPRFSQGHSLPFRCQRPSLFISFAHNHCHLFLFHYQIIIWLFFFFLFLINNRPPKRQLLPRLRDWDLGSQLLPKCFSFNLNIFFWLCLQHMEIHGSGIESKLQLQPVPQLQQFRTLN